MLYRKGITVIIPTYNRRDLLNKTLLSLCFQSFNLYDYEVIVVDDGSSDDTKDIVLSFKDRIFISYFHQEDKGFRVAKARNLGIVNAHFNVCLFLDSGVIAHPDLLKNHWAMHKGKSELAAVGFAYGYCDYENLSASLLKEFANKTDVENTFEMFRAYKNLRDRRAIVLEENSITVEDISIPWIIFWTCHVSCSTKSLMRVAGFDEAFQSWGGEDIELGLRLHAAGVPFAFAYDCEAIHCPHERSVIPLEKSVHYTQYLYKKHPSKATLLLTQAHVPWVEIVKSVRLQELPLNQGIK